MLKILELFSGTESISNAFRQNNHEVFTVDYNNKFKPSLCIDILELTSEMIIEMFGKPDIIWASPECTTYSIAAISHHRSKLDNGYLAPKSEFAKKIRFISSTYFKINQGIATKILVY